MRNDKIANYNILTLGASGAGKTVFLASLFKHLSLATDEGIYLEVDHQQQKKLNAIYAQVASEEEWPAGTRETTTWCFTCCVKTHNLQDYPICQFSYIDYKGGILTDINEDGSDCNFDTKEIVENADAVIVLIDGLQLYKYIDSGYELKDQGVVKWLYRDLPSLLKDADHVKKKPLHFVVTKWDLLEGKYNFSTVIDCLGSRCKEFKKLIEIRKTAGCPVRLIPISSVGNKFVTMLDGRMKKNLRIIPEPFQLEIPLSYLLIDQVVTSYKSIDDYEILVEEKLSFWLDLIPDAFKRGRVLTREQRIEALKNVSDTRTAFSYLFQTFVANIKNFEDKYPEANLNGDINFDLPTPQPIKQPNLIKTLWDRFFK